MSTHHPRRPDAPAGDDEARFTALWEDFAARVQAYALRHVDSHRAQEVVSETFLVAWRRRSDVPPDPLPWLIVTARHIMANQDRSVRRRQRMELDLVRVAHLAGTGAAADVGVQERDVVLRALRALSQADREVLLLTAWDGLTTAQAAEVSGCSAASFAVRLSRARRRLSRRLSDAEADSDPAQALAVPVVEAGASRDNGSSALTPRSVA